MGNIISQARDFIYKGGFGIASAAVELLLKAQSWIPTSVSIPIDDQCIVKKALTRRNLLERIRRSTRIVWIGLLHHVGSRSPA